MDSTTKNLQDENKARLAKLESAALSMFRVMALDLEQVLLDTPEKNENKDVAGEESDDEALYDDLNEQDIALIRLAWQTYGPPPIPKCPYTEAAQLKDRYRYALMLCQDKAAIVAEDPEIVQKLLAHWTQEPILCVPGIAGEASLHTQKDLAEVLNKAEENVTLCALFADAYSKNKHVHDNPDLQREADRLRALEVVDVAQQVLPFIQKTVLASGPEPAGGKPSPWRYDA